MKMGVDPARRSPGAVKFSLVNSFPIFMFGDGYCVRHNYAVTD